jgi:hypothetical protein
LAVVIHGESSRFLADFDQVPFDVTDLEELGIAIALDGASEDAAAGQVFMCFLQLTREDYRNDRLGPIESRLLYFSSIIEQDSGFTVAW